MDCGSVCCGNWRSFCLDIVKPRTDVDNLSVTEKFESGKAIVTLEMASGLKYRLDTLSSVVRNNRVNVAFEIMMEY